MSIWGQSRKITIGNKLFRSLFVMLLLMAMIAVGGLVCIKVLKKTSSKIVVEYLELAAVQDLKNSFNETMIPLHNYLHTVNSDEYSKYYLLIEETEDNLAYCKKSLSARHSKEIIKNFEGKFEELKERITAFSNNEKENESADQIFTELELINDKANKEIDLLIKETKYEIAHFVNINKTASNHSSLVIIILSVSLGLLSMIWGSIFVKKLTKPIGLLVDSTQKVANGDLTSKAKINTKDELGDLAKSFNKMVENLNESTVSRNYLNGILKSMFNSLIVTDTGGEIKMVNKATTELTGYNKDELLGEKINIILSSKNKNLNDKNSIDSYVSSPNCSVEVDYLSKNQEVIPVLFSCSRMKDDTDKTTGIVFAAHDLRERKEIEKRLLDIRREQTVVLNEAQENEKMRIATEIHDGLGQVLTGISYYIENNFSDYLKEDNNDRQKFLNLQTQIDNAIQESRTIAYDLSPILLKDFGLVIAIENLVEQINSSNELKINYSVFNCEKRFDEKLEKILFRIVQEALNNIIKHSEASASNIQIVNHTDSISLLIEDNGNGFDLTKASSKIKNKGIGLISMEERVASFNGMFSINSKINKGTEILIEIPLKA